jgi:regulator of replication initiation timing
LQRAIGLKNGAMNGSGRSSFRSHLFHQPFGGVTMLKKILLGSAIVLGAGGLLLGTSAVSYVRTGYHSIRDTIKEQIPLDVEIKRARDLISDLKPEIAGNLKVIAREEVEVARLQHEVQAKKATLAKSKQAILKLKDDAQSGVRFVTYGGKDFDMAQVKKDLSDRFKSYQTQEATTDKLEKILTAREKNLEGARRKLDEMLAAKRQLEVEVENLQARLTMVEVAKTSNQFSVNDSRVSSVRQVVSDIGTRIDVEERMADTFETYVGIPVSSEDSPTDLIEQITSYFDRSHVEGESLVDNR